MSTLEIRDLHVTVDTESGTKEILRGVDLTIRSGETHAIMGPNGSGKSTLAYSIAGHPKYTITQGSVTLDGEDLLSLKVDERARAGLFLAMQYPVEVPGVSVANFLRTAKTAIDGEAPKLRTWVKDVNAAMDRVQMDREFAQRSVNEGFSGGEKKRHEIVQLELLNPQFAILDETDSGLDIDALRIVSEGVNRFSAQGDRGVLLITHYTRILRYIKPDFVHVFVAGRVAEEGGAELAEQLEAEGYDRYVRAAARPGSEPAPADDWSGAGLMSEYPAVIDLAEVDVPAARRHERDGGGDPVRRRAHPRRLPDLGAHGRGLAAGLPGQRQHLAEAAVGGRGDRGPLPAPQRQRGPGDAHARRRGDRGVRGCPGEGRPLHRGEPVRGDRLHQERVRGAEPVAPTPRRGTWARRRDRHLGDGAPLQHRAVAAGRGADRRHAALVRRHRRRAGSTSRPRRNRD